MICQIAFSFTSFHFYQKPSGQLEPVSSPNDGNGWSVLLSLISSLPNILINHCRTTLLIRCCLAATTIFHWGRKDNSLITRVINYAISHTVQHSSISLLCFSSLRILLPLFNTCRFSLKTLELESFSEFVLLRGICLPTLTTLHLSSSVFSPVPSNSNVQFDPFAGLVNLKILKLENCRKHGAGGFKISGPQLHSLTLCGTDSLFGCKVEIFAPKLRSFVFTETYPVDFLLLETANVDAYLSHLIVISHLNLINMFRGLYNAQSLYLTSNTIKVH